VGVLAAVFLFVRTNWAGYRTDWARWHYYQGTVYNRAGRMEDAVREYAESVRRNPDYPSARVDLGCALALRGDTAGAVEQLEGALRLDPADAWAHYNLGVLLELGGRLGDSAAHYEETLRLDPGFRKAQAGLQRIREGQPIGTAPPPASGPAVPPGEAGAVGRESR
jgi:tetratricopeptide (TPR) repeat protein